MMKKKIKKLAKMTKRQLPDNITYQDLKAYLAKDGWTVCEYRPTGGSKGNQLLKALGLESYAGGKESFVYCQSGQKIIFLAISESVSPTRALRLLAHEIGHIQLQHDTQEICFLEDEQQQEIAANYFADVLLKPKRRKFKLTIASGIILLTIVVALYAHSILALDYYITADGDRYHIADCSHIQGRQVELISKHEATKRGYGPCQDCIK